MFLRSKIRPRPFQNWYLLIKSVLSSDWLNFSDNSEFGIGNDWDDLKKRLSSVKKSCGEVCDQTIEGNIHRGPSLMWFFYTCYLPRQSAKQCTHAGISMTSLLTHNVAHSTRHSFRPKTNNQPIKKFLSLAFSCVKVFKNWTSF